MLSLVIKGGKIIDGTGSKSYTADIGIVKDKIAVIGNLSDVECEEVIDAKGKVVTPGFVDPHSHADLSLHKDNAEELLKPLIMQGVTTFVGGNCGMALSPILEPGKEFIYTYIEVFSSFDPEKEFKWSKTAEYFDSLEKKGIPLNSAILAPHGLLRLHGVGPENRYAKPEEIKKMATALEECMEAGCVGMSTGLQYFPGSQSNTEELIELGKVLKKYEGIFTSHLRSYSNTLELALEEVFKVARENEIRAQVSHLFWVPDFGLWGPFLRKMVRFLAGIYNWLPIPVPVEKPIAEAIENIVSQRKRGISVSVDVMPTTTGFTHLLAFFPPWALEGNRTQVLNRLKDKEVRKKILHSIEHGRMVWPHTGPDSWTLNLFRLMGWECAHIMAVKSDKNKRYEGMNLVQIAEERGVHPFDAACDLLLEEEGHVLVFESIAEPDDPFTERTTYPSMSHPEVMVSTDSILMGFGMPSPLFYGCYPKFIRRYCKELKIVDLETAIKKCTGLPAEHFKIKERGLVKEGYYADIVIFDYENIDSQACFKSPNLGPTGIEEVIINGNRVVKKGVFNSGLNAGRLLKYCK
ncbi:MAG: D-aminoacylase [Candidatus Hydrogenedentes bacterium]|nr:D-aminoacylase [Candidatus Hydrogenedentota bacterium]